MADRSGKIIAIGAAAVIASFVAYHALEVKPERERRERDLHAATKAADDKRFAEWATVVKAKEITPGEIIRLVVIPARPGDISPSRCFIYTNIHFKTSSMHCPDSAQTASFDDF